MISTFEHEGRTLYEVTKPLAVWIMVSYFKVEDAKRLQIYNCFDEIEEAIEDYRQFSDDIEDGFFDEADLIHPVTIGYFTKEDAERLNQVVSDLPIV